MPHLTTQTEGHLPSLEDIGFRPAEPDALDFANQPPSPETVPFLEQAFGPIKTIVRDPVGTLVGVVEGIVSDFKAVATIMPDELNDPVFRHRMELMGFDVEALRAVAERNALTIDVEEREDAAQRITALSLGTVASLFVGSAIGPVSGAIRVAGKTLADFTAFGTVFGSLTPLEEGETRAGVIAGTTLLGIPFAAAGGTVSFVLSRFIRARGLKPRLETPEVAPISEGFRPLIEIEEGAPFSPTTTLSRQGVETATARMAATQARQAARIEAAVARGSVAETEAQGLPAARRRLTEVRQMPPGDLTALPEGAPRILGERFPGQLGQIEALQRRVSVEDLARVRRNIVEAEAAGLTPEMTAVLKGISIGEKAAKRPYTWNEFYTNYLDRGHPVNVAVTELTGRELSERTLPGIQDPYVLWRLTKGSIGKANAMLESGVLDFKTLQPVTRGLREILQPVLQANRLDALRTFLVSQRAVELHGRGLKQPFNLSQAQAVLEQAEPFVRETAQQVLNYQDALLQYVVDSGALSGELAKAFRQANANYVPFYRFFDDVPAQEFPGGPRISGQRTANLPRAAGLKRLKGSEDLAVVDPFESIQQNTYALTSLADRAAVGDALVRLAETVPDQQIIREVPLSKPIRVTGNEIVRQFTEVFEDLGINAAEQLAEEAATIFRPREFLPPGTIRIFKDGKAKLFEVDSQLYDAMLDVGRESTNQIVQLMAFPTRVLRAGATLSLSFIARNPFRDQFTAAVFSKHGFIPGYDLARGIFSVMQKDELYQAFRRSGAQHAALVRTTGAERIALQRNLEQLLETDGVFRQAWRTVRGPRGWLEGLRQLSEAMEEATRVQEFARGLAEAGDQRLTAFAGRDVTLDFQRMGVQIRVMNQLTAFFNANVQGVDKMIRAFRENPAGAGARALGYITLPTLALYWLNKDDPFYQELTQARKDFLWNIPTFRFNDESGKLERTGEFISLPIPFELGLIFKTFAERTARWIDEKDPEAFDGFIREFMAGTPLNPLSAIPTAIRGPLENVTNYRTFRKGPVIPRSEEDLLPELQVSPFEGPSLRILGRILNTSPRNVRNLVESYTAGLGTTAVGIADSFIDALKARGLVEGEPSARLDRPEEVPIIGPLIRSFLTREPTISSRSRERFFRIWTEIQRVKNSLNELSRDRNVSRFMSVRAEYRAEAMAFTMFQQTATAMNAMIAQMNAVRNSNASPELKNEVNLINGRIVRQMARNAVDQYNLLRETFVNPPDRRPSNPAVTLEEILAPAVTPLQLQNQTP